MGKKLNIRPTSSVYATYKRLSYQPWTAIAEFVDNSTQSFYDHQEELMNTKYYDGLIIEITYRPDEVEGDTLTIRDNAYGMEWPDFQRAIILDRPPIDTSGRNEFGMGLKTAASWFGSLWSVESTQLNSKNKYYAEINTDELGKYKTEEIDVEEETVHPREHYTEIVIRNLNKKIRGSRTVTKVKNLLSSIYRQDIRSGLVKIYYNGSLLQFTEPPVYIENANGVNKIWKKEVAFSVNHEGKELTVSGFIAIRLPGSVKEAGFTLLRRGRVIVGGSEKNYRPTELFGDSNKAAYQRLYGELNMDNWPVTQAKDSFDWHNSGLEEEFIDTLRPLTEEYRRKAENIRVRERVTATDLVNSAVNGLRESGMIEDVSVGTSDSEIAEADEETQETCEENDQTPELTDTDHDQGELANQGGEEVIAEGDNPVVIDGDNRCTCQFKYKGTEYIFRITLDEFNQIAHWLSLTIVSETEDQITVDSSINMQHGFFKPLIEKKEFWPIMIRLAIALALAEIEAIKSSMDGRIEPGDLRIKMSDILETVQKEVEIREEW